MPNLNAVKGFLTPSMTQEQPGGGMLNGFSDPRDINMIEKGYACGNCCATFFTFQLDCPLCGQATHITKQRQAAPEMWQAHVDERHADIPTKGPGRREPITAADIELARATLPRSPDEFFAALAKDSDVEQIPLSKLGPRRNRSAR